MLRTDNAVVTKDPNRVTSYGVIKSGHHIAYVLVREKRNAETLAQMSRWHKGNKSHLYQRMKKTNAK
jgi:hypothetical protein